MVLSSLKGHQREARPRSSSSITSTLNRLHSRMSTPTKSKSPKKIKTAFDNLSEMESGKTSPKIQEEVSTYGATENTETQRGSLRSLLSRVDNIAPASNTPEAVSIDTAPKEPDNCHSFRNTTIVESLRSYLTSGATDDESRPILPLCDADCSSYRRVSNPGRQSTSLTPHSILKLLTSQKTKTFLAVVILAIVVLVSLLIRETSK